MDLRLNITSDPENVPAVRRAIEAFCARAGADPKVTADVGLVVNEALANIIRHAYRGAVDRPISVEAKAADGILEIRLRDWGSGEDPSFSPEKTDPLTPGGLGLVCIRKLMDGVKFSRQPDGMLLELKKRIGTH